MRIPFSVMLGCWVLAAQDAPVAAPPVEDPIPAGTEFIERDDLYKLKEEPPWWRYFFSRRELHDDRMALFRSYFYDSQQNYFYLLKVVNPGKFRVSPAHVQPMYQPKYISTTEGREVEFK